MQAVVSLVLLLAGGFFTWELLVGPTVDVIRATTWVATPCRIADAGVTSSRPTGPERPFARNRQMLHTLEVSFQYEAGGKERVSRRYSFAKDVRTSGSRLARKIVALYPTGREATCYVNPKDPAEAVINRRFQGSMLLGLAPLLLFLVGFFGLTGVLFEGSEGGATRSRWRRKKDEGGAPARPLGEHYDNGHIAVVGFAGLALFGLLAAIGSEVSNLAYLAAHFAVVGLLAVGYHFRSFAAAAALAVYTLLLFVSWLVAFVAPDATSSFPFLLLRFLGDGAEALLVRASGLPRLAAEYAAEVSAFGILLPAILALVVLGARRLYLDREVRPVGQLGLFAVAAVVPALFLLEPAVQAGIRRVGLLVPPPTAEDVVRDLDEAETSRLPGVCDSVGRLRDLPPDAVPALVRAAERLTGPDRASCLYPLQAAGERGKAAEALLVASLGDPEDRVKHAAASALGALAPHLDPSRAVPALASVAPVAAPAVRRAAATSLGKFGPAAASAVPALAGLLDDADPEVREAAVRSLGEVGPLAAPATADLARLVDDPGTGHARRTAAETLGKIGPAAREALPSLLRFHASAEPDTRAAILTSLASIAPESEEVVDLLARATAYPDAFGSAYLAFREVGPRGAPVVPRLVELLASPDPETRTRAFDALGAIGPGASAATPALARLAADSREETCNRALEVLWKIGPGARDALPSVRNALSSPSDGTRSSALYALATIAPDSEEALREATKALVEADPASALGQTAASAFEVIGARGEPSVPRIVELLSSPSFEARTNAARALGGIGPGAAAALPKLRELSRDPGPGPEGAGVATAAGDALRKIEAAPAAVAAGTPPAQVPTTPAPPSR